jgi:hypothetical protein
LRIRNPTERYSHPDTDEQVQQHDLDAVRDAQADVPLDVWSGPPRATEPEEDHASGDDDVTLHHRHHKLNGDADERQNGKGRRNNARQRSAWIFKERGRTGAVHQGASHVQSAHEDCTGTHRASSGCTLTEDVKAIDDRRYPIAAIQEKRIKSTDPHDSADQSGSPRLEICLFEHHNGCTPGKLYER